MRQFDPHQTAGAAIGVKPQMKEIAAWLVPLLGSKKSREADVQAKRAMRRFSDLFARFLENRRFFLFRSSAG
ncbi:hypothetical protein [Leisingera sp. ANG-M6]|uniref:hypothetical protein n=1 Tax=Leisingera sp. ANG-M6 TaxID=1577900 RepID=UPI00057CAC9C|nr:hypothetical protein [Leisingera sp. ANG-M6]KIC30992.1 hypothetical protein RA24_01115 [Leisingera sp. ANG-M6]